MPNPANKRSWKRLTVAYLLPLVQQPVVFLMVETKHLLAVLSSLVTRGIVRITVLTHQHHVCVKLIKVRVLRRLKHKNTMDLDLYLTSEYLDDCQHKICIIMQCKNIFVLAPLATQDLYAIQEHLCTCNIGNSRFVCNARTSGYLPDRQHKICMQCKNIWILGQPPTQDLHAMQEHLGTERTNNTRFVSHFEFAEKMVHLTNSSKPLCVFLYYLYMYFTLTSSFLLMVLKSMGLWMMLK